MKICFKGELCFSEGLERLRKILDFEISDDGVELVSVQGEKVGASLKEGKATIYYNSKNQFFREFGVLLQNAKTKDEFEIVENTPFKTIGVMIDASRCAVPKVSTVYETLDYLAVMGYNMAMLYTEDVIELESRPYFGYMRGRYTKDELKAMDDYAYDYGIEMIPCLECYGHMGKYLLWSEAYEIKDTAQVLLAREEKTFEFLDELIGTVSGCFRTNRIHIGMDEAWDMGRGRFLDKNGYVEPIEIFNEYMDRLVGITNKYNLIPMMWSDMYFRTVGGGYYQWGFDFPENLKKSIPKEVQLVFWHYGECPGCDNEMIKKHLELNRDVIFAGGLWSWSGHYPEHNHAYESAKFSIDACRKNGITEMMTTMWKDDNAECDHFSNLFGLSFNAELCYNENPSDEYLKERFEFVTGGDYDAFYNMSKYHNRFGEDAEYKSYSQHFLGKPLFWQDVMEGMFDTHLYDKTMSEHYKTCAEEMKKVTGKWDYIYKHATTVFEYLSLKAEFGEKAVPAYKKGDVETLKYLSDVVLPKMKEKLQQVHNLHKEKWIKLYKMLGWSNLDIRYGGLCARIDTAKMFIDQYLAGQIEQIEEFEEPRLHKGISGFTKYTSIATPIGQI